MDKRITDLLARLRASVQTREVKSSINRAENIQRQLQPILARVIEIEQKHPAPTKRSRTK